MLGEYISDGEDDPWCDGNSPRYVQPFSWCDNGSDGEDEEAIPPQGVLVSRQEYLVKHDEKKLQKLQADLEDETFLCADSMMLPSLKQQRGDDVQVAQPAQDCGIGASVHYTSLLDVLGALQRGSWSLQHPVVAAFLSQHLPTAAAVCSDDVHATVAVIVILRSKFKHSKAGWRVHVKRAAKSARAALGDAVYSSHKALVAGALAA
jgi:hypothetical protein